MGWCVGVKGEGVGWVLEDGEKGKQRVESGSTGERLGGNGLSSGTRLC